MIKAVIFDFGRVISAQKSPSLFLRYERELGLKPDTINRLMFDSRAWQEALLGRLTEAQYWEAVGPDLGLTGQHAIDSFRHRYRQDEAVNTAVVELIRRLHGRYRIGLLSNAPPGLEEWLEDWKIRELFDVVFCSGHEGLAKPDPAAFEKVLARLEVAPEETIFIDDTLEHVLAAQTLGIHGLLFTTAEALAEQLAAIPIFF